MAADTGVLDVREGDTISPHELPDKEINRAKLCLGNIIRNDMMRIKEFLLKNTPSNKTLITRHTSVHWKG
ncbi:hypothetical protein CHS0354_001051 [Potamilus streckersoni]|uniref:Uncharacterized protein n=1 Tax=Potamilus streckersoni TaxID=2493646 RepID=A0AAE0SUZ2_9BIVA|nr:hypothetical protein CHS0354_001051 [Potamilus streckersoni]